MRCSLENCVEFGDCDKPGNIMDVETPSDCKDYRLKQKARGCHYGHRDSCEKTEDMQAVLIDLANQPCCETSEDGCMACRAQMVLLKYCIVWRK